MSKNMTLKAARDIAGSIGFPTKMPGTSYGLPAAACLIGTKLAKIPGTACHKCYALVNRHAWMNPVKAQHRRLASIEHPLWADAITRLLLHIHRNQMFKIDLGVKDAKRRGIIRFRLNQSGYHRWHDSGDLQSIEHLAAICEVARRTPKIKHWLPTQELGMLRRYLALGNTIPNNLLIRVSGVMIDDAVRRMWPTTSEVFDKFLPADAHICPAPQQKHRCGSCRACWSSDVAHVAYRLH